MYDSIADFLREIKMAGWSGGGGIYIPRRGYLIRTNYADVLFHQYSFVETPWMAVKHNFLRAGAIALSIVPLWLNSSFYNLQQISISDSH